MDYQQNNHYETLIEFDGKHILEQSELSKNFLIFIDLENYELNFYSIQ